MSRCIITVSREFGSGGRLVAEKLAFSLGIPFYDRAIIQITAEKSGLSPKFIEQNEENIPSSFLYNLVSTSYSSLRYTAWNETPTNDKTFFAQSEVIRELAQAGSCVIVGRCADYILRDDPDIVRIFIYSSLQDRLKRGIKSYGLKEPTASDKIKKIDKSRANYYKYYTGQQWGDVHSHEIIINTEFTGIDGAVEVIKANLRQKGLIA